MATKKKAAPKKAAPKKAAKKKAPAKKKAAAKKAAPSGITLMTITHPGFDSVLVKSKRPGKKVKVTPGEGGGYILSLEDE